MRILSRSLYMAAVAVTLAGSGFAQTTEPQSRDFLQPILAVDATSPTLQRGGEAIPLRPEMLVNNDENVTIPQVSQVVLPNGIRVFALESRESPSLYFIVFFKGGSSLDPADKVGLATLTAAAWRAGGTGSLSPDDFDQKLDEIGSQLSISTERNMVRLDMFALSEKREEALALLEDLLLHPAFNEKQFDQRKALNLEELRRENDEPSDVARREFRKELYGADNPLGRIPTTATVSSVELADARSFYETNIAPSVCWFGIAGDAGEAEATKWIEDKFASWSKPAPPVAALPEPSDKESSRPQILLIPRRTAQSQIRLGHLSIARNSPLLIPAEVMSSIYGMSGFSSRLLTEVRTKRGYAYAVGGGVLPDDPRGIFFAVAGSKAASTCAALSTMMEVTSSTARGTFSEKELDTARREVVHGFITKFDVPRKILTNRMIYDMQGYPSDFIDKFVERVRGVSAADVTNAAKEIIQSSRLRILVVGDPSTMDCDLTQLGDVTVRLLEPGDSALLKHKSD
ncbi:hypothetical protein CVU37_11165 [candidate division BRC1 bacterium HGW-BRC1-1]|nr:MAG: hypothetical protein CVU37_11165 [candidate division BRC1 bacterium HGW-BRC1-1]